METLKLKISEQLHLARALDELAEHIENQADEKMRRAEGLRQEARLVRARASYPEQFGYRPEDVLP